MGRRGLCRSRRRMLAKRVSAVGWSLPVYRRLILISLFARSLVLRWFFRIGFLRRDVIFQRAAHVFIFHVIHALFLLVILQKPWISKIRRCFFKLALL